MSYFSSMVSAASKLVAGSSLPYELGEERTSFAGKTPWRLYAGRSKKLECDVTVFLFELKKGTEAQAELARNAMRRYRTLKHPYCVKCLESGEIAEAGIIYLLTEPVTPLADALAELSQTPSSLVWGLYTLAAAVNFLSIDCKMIHGQISLASVFVDKGMDWKLGGFEMAIEAAKADASYFSNAAATLPKRYQSPELARGNIDVLSNLPVAADWWALGCTIFEIFCGEIRSPADLKKIGSMPEPLKPDYMRLLSANTQQRLRPIELLQNSMFEDAYVSLHLFLEMLNVKDSVEKDRFFSKLAERVPAMPKPAAQWKVLPALTNSLEYGGASAKALEPLLRIASVLSEDEMQAQVVPTVVKLFANTDRAMRIPLLQTLPQLMEHLSQRTVNESVFGHVALGFADTSPRLRELTVMSMVDLAPKLSRATLGQVMRAFAKLQLDEEPAIRTNTTICLGKIAQYLDATERERVLIPAFTRALKDPFPHGRNAGILSLTATQQYYKPMDAAVRVLPAIAPMVLDPERDVRETALGCLNAYVLKLQQASAAMSRPQGETQTEKEKEASDHAVAAAAESVLKSMSWLTSAAQKLGGNTGAGGGASGTSASGGGTSGVPAGAAGAGLGGSSCVLKPNEVGVGGGAGRPPPPPPPGGVPLQPSYSPPAVPAGAMAAALPKPATGSDGWGDDDLSDAFAAAIPAPPPPPSHTKPSPLGVGGAAPSGPAKTLPVDPFASLSLGKPPAVAPAPSMRISSGVMGTSTMGTSGLGGGAVCGCATSARTANGVAGSAGLGGGMGAGLCGGMGVATMGGGVGQCTSSSSIGSIGGSSLATSTGSLGSMQPVCMGALSTSGITPLAPMNASSNLMNFGAPAAQPKPNFDSLDPLAMLAASNNKPNKMGATRVDGKNDDWDSW